MAAQELPRPGPREIRRESRPAAGTICYLSIMTDGGPWMSIPRTRDIFLTVLRSWHAQRNGRLLAVMAMPDVAHVLLELGSLLTASQIVAGWKVAVRHGAGYPRTFRDDFHAYELRADEAIEDYGLYMFLAPYRAKLLPLDKKWEGWWLPDPSVFQFPASLNAAGGPPQEWVNWPASRFAGLARKT